MKKFDFRLQKVLRLKEIAEQSRKRNLGIEVKSLNVLKGKLHEAEDLASEFRGRFNALPRQGELDTAEFRRYQSYQNLIGISVKEAQLDINEQNEKVDIARDELRKARCQTQIFEKMREKSLEKYKKEMQQAFHKEIDEFSLQRFGRMNREKGSAASQFFVAMASACFLAILLFIGALIGLGHLNISKLKLIAHVLGYSDEMYKKDRPEFHLVVGEENPYVIHSTSLKQLQAIQKKYSEMLSTDLDDEMIITKQVLDERKLILDRVKNIMFEQEKSLRDSISQVNQKSAELSKREDDLKLARKAFAMEGKKRSDEKFNNAVESALQAYKSIDPEVVADFLTSGRPFDDYERKNELDEAVAYVSSYVSKMSPRQRAGVLEALGPKWAFAVQRYQETK